VGAQIISLKVGVA